MLQTEVMGIGHFVEVEVTGTWDVSVNVFFTRVSRHIGHVPTGIHHCDVSGRQQVAQLRGGEQEGAVVPEGGHPASQKAWQDRCALGKEMREHLKAFVLLLWLL